MSPSTVGVTITATGAGVVPGASLVVGGYTLGATITAAPIVGKGRSALLPITTFEADVRARVETLVQLQVVGRGYHREALMPDTVALTIFPREDVVVMARPVAPSGPQLTQDHVIEAWVEVFGSRLEGAGDQPIYGEALDVADVMLTAPLIDGAWRAGTPGYSFRHVLAGAELFVSGGRSYQAVYQLDTTAYGMVTIEATIHTRAGRSSL